MSDNKNIYESLLLQYNNLSELEKNAILIYKSNLYVVINAISRIPEYQTLTSLQIEEKLINREECIHIFHDYSAILDDLRNSFIKNTVFSSIHFDSFTNFIDDIKKIIEILNQICFKIVLEEDIVVYRSILLEPDTDINFLDNSPAFISTSIKLEDAEKFLNGDSNMQKHLYQIKLSKGIPVIVSPFTIVRKYASFGNSLLFQKDYSLMVANRGVNGQQEIILFKDCLVSKEISNKKVQCNSEDIYLHFVEMNIKEKESLNQNLKHK